MNCLVVGSLIFIVILLFMNNNIENFKASPSPSPGFFHKLLHILLTPFRFIMSFFTGNKKFKYATNYHCVHDKDDKLYWMESIDKDKKYNCPTDGDWQTHDNNVCLDKHSRQIPYDKRHLVKEPSPYNTFLDSDLGQLQLHKDSEVKAPVLNEINNCKVFKDFNSCKQFNSKIYDNTMFSYDNNVEKTSQHCK